MDSEPQYRECIVQGNDDEEDLEFEGYQVASASSKSETNNARWTELFLYQTKAGSHVCQQVGRSSLDGEKSFYSSAVAHSNKDVTNFFGHGWLAKQLYRDANIITTKRIA